MLASWLAVRAERVVVVFGAAMVGLLLPAISAAVSARAYGGSGGLVWASGWDGGNVAATAALGAGTKIVVVAASAAVAGGRAGMACDQSGRHVSVTVGVVSRCRGLCSRAPCADVLCPAMW